MHEMHEKGISEEIATEIAQQVILKLNSVKIARIARTRRSSTSN